MITARALNLLGHARRGAEHWMRYVASYPSGGSGFDKSPVERRATLLDDAGGLFADVDAGLGEVPEDRLESIDVSTTIIDCKLSPSFLRRSCKRLRGLMPHARTVTIEKSGHHVGIDAREGLVALLREVAARRHAGTSPLAN